MADGVRQRQRLYFESLYRYVPTYISYDVILYHTLHACRCGDLSIVVGLRVLGHAGIYTGGYVGTIYAHREVPVPYRLPPCVRNGLK